MLIFNIYTLRYIPEKKSCKMCFGNMHINFHRDAVYNTEKPGKNPNVRSHIKKLQLPTVIWSHCF